MIKEIVNPNGIVTCVDDSGKNVRHRNTSFRLSHCDRWRYYIDDYGHTTLMVVLLEEDQKWWVITSSYEADLIFPDWGPFDTVEDGAMYAILNATKLPL